MSVTVRPYKRGGWEVDLRISLPDGSEHRQRRRSPLASKSAAQRWGEERERHWYQELTQPKAAAQLKQKEAPTLEEFSSRFLEGHARANRQKPSSVASKETILRVHLLPALGGRRLNEITNEHVQQLKWALRDKAPKTVNNVLSVLNILLKKGVEWEVIPALPCRIQLLPTAKMPASFHDFDDYDRLVAAAKAKDWRTHLIVLLGGEAGLRCGEMVALEWKDVDFVKRQLCVRQSDWRGQITTPKNGRVRYVPMTVRLAAALRDYRHRRGSRVLCKNDGHPLTRQSAWGRVRRAARAASVPTGVHILRHSFCSFLAMRGAPGRSIQELAGHQELSMTQRYMHLSPAALGDAIRLLDTPQMPSSRGDIVETAKERQHKASV
jgi:integrase